MLNGNGGFNQPQQQPEQAPVTMESLQRELGRANQLIQLFRQQRDNANSMANDLQIEFLFLQQKLKEYEEKYGPMDQQPAPFIDQRQGASE